MEKETIILRCLRCGQFHFGVSVAQAKLEIERWHENARRLPLPYRSKSTGPSLEGYARCFKCRAPYTELVRVFGHEQDGRTIQPVLFPWEMLQVGG